MSYQGYIVLAVVPARGGSKGIPRKNLCKVGGISLVGRAVQIAKSVSWIDQVVLSTDDEEIAEEGRKHGASVPFMRPDELSGDMSTSIDMWQHAWLTSEEFFEQRFDISILLEPTSPLRTAEDIEQTVKKLIETNAKAAATVSPTPAHFTPHKTLTVEDGKIGYYLSSEAKHSIRQTIPQYYHRNGLCYAVKRSTLIDEGVILDDQCSAVIVDRPVVNIDEPIELEIAELLIKISCKKIQRSPDMIS